jgi:hypothetical protein
MDEIDLLYDKRINCPICNNEFLTKKVRFSKLKLIKKDADFLSYYENINPLIYNIFVCPNCGYAATEDRYEKVPDKDRQIILDEISSKWNKRSYGDIRDIDNGIESQKLALYIGELLEYKKLELASLCLNIAWLYRIKEEEEEYRFLELAKEFYEFSYYNEGFVSTNMGQLKLAYLIGELNRQLGNKEDALKWFNVVISDSGLKSNKVLEKLVREQWNLTR